MERQCANPGCSNVGKHLCSGCGEDIYCSKDCQKSHWPSHKVSCKTAVKPEAAIILQSFEALSVKQLQNLLKAKAATFEKKKKEKVLSKLETVVEKPALVKLVKEHVAPNEIEALLSASGASRTAAVSAEAAAAAMNAVNNNPNAASSSAKKKLAKQQQNINNALNQTRGGGAGGQPTPTPEQLREQAAFMRKNPGMVRKAQPAFANLTDEQIRDYANQLEQAANNPDMMKEVERMSKLSDSDRTLLQTIQEGLSGAKPIDDAWINTIITAIKKKPHVFKTMLKGKGAMFGGVSDEQVESYIDMASRMEKWTLRLIAYGIWYLSSAVKPATEIYKTVDSYTFGSARYLVFALFAFVMYYLSYFTFNIVRFIVVRLFSLGQVVYGMITNTPVASTATTTAATNTAASSASSVLNSFAASSSSVKDAATAAATATAAKVAADSVQQTTTTSTAADAEFEF